MRMACVNADGLVVSVQVVDDFESWVSRPEVMELAAVHYAGGLYALDDTDEVSALWRRVGDRWLPPKREIEQILEEIEEETQARIALGYSFRGLQFSLSERHQATTRNLLAAMGTPLAMYPVTRANIDDTAWITLESDEDVVEMAVAMATTLTGILEQGNARKRAAREAA